MPTKFLDVLPDPDYKIDSAGFQDAAGDPGPGFARVKLVNVAPVDEDRTMTGIWIPKKRAAAYWTIDINYNPMTLAEFTPVYTFLMQKRGRRLPFFVSLPQYKLPKDSSFATHVQSVAVTTAEAGTVGISAIEMDSSSWPGYPKFGDLFTITDTSDTLHTKAYMISHVETGTDYQTGNAPGAGNIRAHFSPPLIRPTTSGSTVNFDGPLIKVAQKGDIQQYKLDAEGLYSFSIKLEEAIY
jgi:hypothetical protein